VPADEAVVAYLGVGPGAPVVRVEHLLVIEGSGPVELGFVRVPRSLADGASRRSPEMDHISQF